MNVRSKKWWLAFASIMGAVLVALLMGLRPSHVRLVRPEHRDIVETVVVSGRVMAPARVNIGAQASGTVIRVLHREGDHVRAGEVLVQLDDREQAAQRAQAEAQLAQAKASRAKVTQVGALVATEELKQAQLALERARTELERQKKLHDAGAGTQKDLEDATRALAQAESQTRAAQERASDASPLGAERRRVSAQAAEAEAALALATTRLQLTRVVAPSDGVILERAIEPGDLVQPGKPLFVLATEGETRLYAAIDEKELVKLALGQHALAAAEAARDRPFDAEVAYIAPAIDPQRATVEVRLRVPRPPSFLRPDMTVSIDIRVGQKSQALVVPATAVRDLASAPWVLVADGGRARKQPIRIGLRGDSFVEVTAGLTENATVIDAPSVLPGARVRGG